ncbi:trypsin-like serine peptidase [Natronococcus wangiae]|uniref:hypothetical protein n=1 Tax=Natronococcus wangiae TaxID=3068275 RepID=UPI00273D0D17|nr:hypothetical protein [Natronococcus sp. AD5]
MVKELTKEIPEAVEEELLERENVVGVGRGRRRVRGQFTDEEVIVTFVERKVEEEELDEDQLVPQSVDIEDQDVDTDVQEAPGGFYALQQQRTASQPMRQQTVPQPTVEEQAVTAPATTRRTRHDRWRQAPAGVSISHPEITFGTLGSPPLVTQEGEHVFLTNAHVAAPMDEAERGDSILQPGRYHGGNNPEDKIGELLEWGDLSADKDNTSDSALVKITGNAVRNDILGLGPLVGWTEANYEEEHMKSGARTNVTSGHLIARDVTAVIDYRPQQLRFTGLDVFEPISAGGDSGSLIGITRQDKSFYATSLLFAGSVRQTLAIRWTPSRKNTGNSEWNNGNSQAISKSSQDCTKEDKSNSPYRAGRSSPRASNRGKHPRHRAVKCNNRRWLDRVSGLRRPRRDHRKPELRG